MSAPMSMEDWQRSLRAQKQEDRQKKQQSQQILNNFRAAGIKDEDEIQKKIRLEEQQKKKDAATYLHNYRPSNVDDMEGVANKKQPSRNNKYEGPLPPVVSAPGKDDPRNSVTAGAVSSIAASFKGNSTPNHQSQSHNEQVHDDFIDNNTNNNAANYSDTDEPVHIDLSEAGNSSQSTSNNSAQEWVQVTSEDAVPMVVSDNEHASCEDEPHFHRLDVDFSFGLISTKEKPSFELYMNAVEEVVQSGLQDTHNVDLKHNLSYDPMYSPFVEKVQNDEYYVDAAGRSNVQRLLVRAVVPVFHSKDITPKKARSFIIKSLAAALKRGYFLQISEND